MNAETPPPGQREPRVEPIAPDSIVAADREEATPLATAQATAGGSQPRRIWRRRFKITFWTLLVAAIVGRVALWLALPTILANAFAGYDIDAQYESLRLSVLGGDIEVWHLSLRDKTDEARTDARELAYAEYCRADISVLQLLRGRVVIPIVEADGAELRAGRNTDGSLRWLDRFIVAGEGTDSVPPTAAEPTANGSTSDPAPLRSLEPPIVVSTLRLQHLHVFIEDEAVSPPLHTRLDVNVRVSNIGSDTRPARVEIAAAGTDFLDRLVIDVTARTAPNRLSAEIVAHLEGLRPQQLAGYLEMLGLEPTAERWSGGVTAEAELSRPTDGSRAVLAHFVARNASFANDDQEAAGFDRLELRAVTGPSSVGLESFELLGVRVIASGGESLHFAGLRADLGTPGLPQAPLALLVDRMTVMPNADDHAGAWDISIAARAPGLVDRMKVVGRCSARDGSRDLDARFTAEGIEPTALQGQLAALGLESRFDNARFAFGLSAQSSRGTEGRWRTSAAISNLALTNDEECLGVAVARIEGLEFDPDRLRLVVETIEIEEPRLQVSRDAEGRLNLLGLRIVNPPSEATTAEVDEAEVAVTMTTSSNPNADAASTPMRIELRRLGVSGTRLVFEDHWPVGRDAVGQGRPVRDATPSTSKGATRIEITDLGGELNDLIVGPAAAAEGNAPRVARLRGWLEMPGLIEGGRLEGDLSTTPSGLAFAAQLGARRLATHPLRPYLEALGVTPTLVEGTFECTTRVELETNPTGLTATARVEDLELLDKVSSSPLLTWKALDLGPVALSSSGIEVADAVLRAPRIHLHSFDDGTLEAFGLRTLPPHALAAGREPAGTAQEATSTAASRGASLETAAPMPNVAVQRIAIEDLGVAWQPPARPTPIRTRLDLELRRLVLGRAAPAATLQARVTITDILEELTVNGELTPEPVAFELAVAAGGIDGAELQPFMPRGLSVDLEAGQFRAALRGSLEPHEEGGQTVVLAVHDVVLGEAGQPPSLVVAGADVLVDRLDLAGGVVRVGAVRTDGIELEIDASRPGEMRFLGLKQSQLPSPPEPAIVPASAEEADSSAAAKEDEATVDTTSPSRPRNASSLERPRVEVDTVELNVQRVTVRQPNPAEPLEVRDLRVSNPSPWVILDPVELEGLAPLSLKLSARVVGLIDEFQTTLEAAPFAREPRLEVKVGVDGFHGDALPRVIPALADGLHANDLRQGSFRTELEATLAMRRRSPLEFDFAQPFGGSLRLGRTEFRDGDGPVLAGVEEVNVDDVRFDPATGSIRVRSIQVQSITSRAALTREGIEALGVVILIPQAPDADSGATAESRKADAPSPGSAPSNAPEPTPSHSIAQGSEALPEDPSPLIAIDQIEVVGLDFLLEDRTTDFPMRIPFNDLEILARSVRFGGAESSSRPMRFSIAVSTDKTPLPGQPDSTPVPVFGDFRVTGNLELEPELRGTVKTQLEGLQLATFRGPASTSGVELVDGVLDSSIQAVFKPNGVLGVDSRFVFTDLDVAEEPGGPIQRYLQLPTPLDAVLFLLRDSAGAISVPLSIKVEDGGVSVGQITRVAVTTLSVLIGNAIASSPFRVVGTAGSLIGLSGEDTKGADSEPLTLPFAAGVTVTHGESRQTLEALIRQLREDPGLVVRLEHETGRGDEDVARQRSNPPPEKCLEVAGAQRLRAVELALERERLAERTREATFVQDEAAAESAAADLRRVERELGEIERSLDQLLELALGRAEHRARRRTREACLALARARLVEVAEILLAAGVGREQVRVKAARFRAAERDGGAWITLTVQPQTP